jgi:hypothetical protein
LPVVSNGFENGSLTLTAEHRPKAFENRVLRGIFGPERQEVTGDWRKQHSEEFTICTVHQMLIG